MNNREAFEAMMRKTFGEKVNLNHVQTITGEVSDEYRSPSVRDCCTLFSALASQAQQEPVSQWQPIATAPKNKKIIVRYKNALGKDRTVFAKYLDKFTEEASEGTDCETDYCEDDDTFYCKEGWVELIDNWDDFSSVYFDSRNVPTHWMPLPPAPEGDKP